MYTTKKHTGKKRKSMDEKYFTMASYDYYQTVNLWEKKCRENMQKSQK